MPRIDSIQKASGIFGVAKNNGKIRLLLNIDCFFDSKEMDMFSRQIQKSAPSPIS